MYQWCTAGNGGLDGVWTGVRQGAAQRRTPFPRYDVPRVSTRRSARLRRAGVGVPDRFVNLVILSTLFDVCNGTLTLLLLS